MLQSWEQWMEAGEVWVPGNMHVLLSQESSQQLPADAFEKQFCLIHYVVFFPPFLISISKGRTLSWSEESCGEWGREKNPKSSSWAKVTYQNLFPWWRNAISFLVAFVGYRGVGKGPGEQECPLEFWAPLAESRLEPSQSWEKANNPGVNLVLSWEASGTRVEYRREEAKQPVIWSEIHSWPHPIPGWGKLGQDSSHQGISEEGSRLGTPLTPLPSKGEQEGREVVWVRARLEKNHGLVQNITSVEVWRLGWCWDLLLITPF